MGVAGGLGFGRSATALWNLRRFGAHMSDNAAYISDNAAYMGDNAAYL